MFSRLNSINIVTRNNFNKSKNTKEGRTDVFSGGGIKISIFRDRLSQLFSLLIHRNYIYSLSMHLDISW